ncbi:MAG TPA: FAD-dependent oxidoreductase, partial [bacterium]|nr:FAD-dependent oxidoreductase [bacterium]
GYVTNETVFAMPTLPRRLLVLGGGPIGLELGQALARLGSQVTVAEALPRLLPREDEDAAALVRQALEAEGLAVHTGARVTGVQATAGGKRVLLERPGAPPLALEVDEILVATGRQPNVEGLGLEQAGVAVHAGGVQVNDRMQTTAPSIYACGDVAGPYLFTHMANQQARVVIQNALLPVPARINYRAVPWCTFTDPEVARVGLNEQEAAQRGIACRVLRVELADIDRAVCDGVQRGFLKVLTPPRSDVILGATLVGPHAGELIHEIIVAMGAGWRLRDLANTVHVYPTLAEVFRRAGDESRKAGFTPTLQALLRTYLRWRRG